MINQVFILVSFFLGIIVGSLVTYVIMGRYFSKAVSEISFDFMHKDEDGDPKHVSKHIELSGNAKIAIAMSLAVISLIAIGLFYALSDKKPTNQGADLVSESLGKDHDIGSINNALKKGSGGY